MLSSVRYHFNGTHRMEDRQIEDSESAQFSLEEEDEGIFATVLDGCSQMAANGGEVSSRLLDGRAADNSGKAEMATSNRKTPTGNAAQGKKESGATGPKRGEQQQQGPKGKSSAQRASNLLRYGSRSKSNSLLIDEVELDDDVEEDELGRHAGGSDDDEDDLLPIALNGSGGAVLGRDAAVAAQPTSAGGAVPSSPWRARLRRRMKRLSSAFSCGGCVPWAGSGFRQFE